MNSITDSRYAPFNQRWPLTTREAKALDSKAATK